MALESVQCCGAFYYKTIVMAVRFITLRRAVQEEKGVSEATVMVDCYTTSFSSPLQDGYCSVQDHL